MSILDDSNYRLWMPDRWWEDECYSDDVFIKESVHREHYTFRKFLSCSIVCVWCWGWFRSVKNSTALPQVCSIHPKPHQSCLNLQNTIKILTSKFFLDAAADGSQRRLQPVSDVTPTVTAVMIRLGNRALMSIQLSFSLWLSVKVKGPWQLVWSLSGCLCADQTGVLSSPTLKSLACVASPRLHANPKGKQPPCILLAPKLWTSS